MFDRFTDKAKKSLNLARMAAQEFGCEYIAPEHMLHGLLCAGECRATQILAASGTPPAVLLTELRGRMAPPQPRSAAQLPFTSGAKRVLELSMEAAAEVGHNWIGTEHLLLGLGQVDSPIVAELFRKHQLTSEKLLQALLATDQGPEDESKDGPWRTHVLQRALRIARELGDEETARRLEALIQRLSR